MRSLQWLIERLHQSYFFYLLPRVDRFVSIAVYYPSLGCLIAALVLRAFALFCVRYGQTLSTDLPQLPAAASAPASEECTPGNEQDDNSAGESHAATDSTCPPAADSTEETAAPPAAMAPQSSVPLLFGELLRLAPVCVLAVLVAAVCGAAPDFLVASSAAMRLPQANTLLAGLATLYFFSLFSPLLFKCSNNPVIYMYIMYVLCQYEYNFM